MNVNLEVRYVTDSLEVVCFKHAVAAAMNNVDINVEIDDFGDENDMRSTQCTECRRLAEMGFGKRVA